MVEVLLTERDYRSAVQATSRPRRRSVIVLAGVTGLLLVTAILAWQLGYVKESVIGTCVWFGSVLGAEIGRRVSIATRAGRVFQQQKGLQRPYRVDWTDEGVTISSDDGETRTPWREFHRYVECEDLFILLLSDAVFFMLPKRAFPDVDSMQQFAQMVHGRVRRR